MDAIKEAMIREEDTGIRDPRLDNYRADLNFVTDGTIERVCARRSRWEETLRDCAKHDLSLALDYAEAAMDHCRAMQRSKFDATTELAETETFLRTFLLAVLLMQGKHESQAE